MGMTRMTTLNLKSRLLGFSDSPLQKILFATLAFFLLVLPAAALLRAGVSERLVLPALLFSVPILFIVSLWAKQFIEHSLVRPLDTGEHANSYDAKYLRFPRGIRVNLIAVVPVHNEGHAIFQQVVDLRKFVDVVLVVDDHSTDGTAERASSAGARVVTLNSVADAKRKVVGFVGATNIGIEIALSEEPNAILLLHEPLFSDEVLSVLVRESRQYPFVAVSTPTRPHMRASFNIKAKLLAALIGASMSQDSASAVVLRADLARRIFPLQAWVDTRFQLSVVARRLGFKPHIVQLGTRSVRSKRSADDISFLDVVRLDLGVSPEATHRRKAV